MIRRLVVFLAVTGATAVGALYWLHDGDLEEAAVPVLARWDADSMAASAGFTAPSSATNAQPAAEAER